MASTTALFTGLSGLNANSRNIDVIGNNIANVNTPAYKGTRLNFSTQLSKTISIGSSPTAAFGGTNPYQIGLGVQTSGTQRNFNNGTISPTGDPRDLAIEGDGFFVMRRGDDQVFTRAGNFRTDSQQYLANPAGDRVQGYGVDENFRIVPGRLVDVQVPLGSLTLAEPTTQVRFRGNLNANGLLPTRGTTIELRGTATDGFRAVAAANPPVGAGNLIEGATRLVDIEDPLLPGSGTAMLSAGQRIEVRGAERGNRTLPTRTFEITSTTTVSDWTAFLSSALGISTGTGNNPDGKTPGVSLDPVTGMLSVTGNSGRSNGIALDQLDLRVTNAAGQTVRSPFVPTTAAEADGESVKTSFIVFDSLGTQLELGVTMVLESRSNAGTTWRYYAESPDNMAAGPLTPVNAQLATGTISFGNQGELLTTTPVTVTIDRTGTGAETPLSIDLTFQGGEDAVTALTSDTSELAATFRDGAPLGTLSNFGVGVDGVVTGSFTNGLTRTIGQLALATFTNNEGLIDRGNNLFSVGANSGSAVINPPGILGAGRTVGGALELSNVDIGEEFIKMILSSTGYSAASRVIRTADELMQQLLVIGR